MKSEYEVAAMLLGIIPCVFIALCAVASGFVAIAYMYLADIPITLVAFEMCWAPSFVLTGLLGISFLTDNKRPVWRNNGYSVRKRRIGWPLRVVLMLLALPIVFNGVSLLH